LRVYFSLSRNDTHNAHKNTLHFGLAHAQSAVVFQTFFAAKQLMDLDELRVCALFNALDLRTYNCHQDQQLGIKISLGAASFSVGIGVKSNKYVFA